MKPEKVVTKVTNTHRHGKYILMDYETSNEPGYVKRQILREQEAVDMLRRITARIGPEKIIEKMLQEIDRRNYESHS